MGLSNQFVENLMRKLSIKPKKFKGVKPCDVFLNEIRNNNHKLEKGDCFIINMSSSQHPGSHFVSIFISSPYNAEYFDSFGFKPLNIYFIEFIKNFTNNAFYYYNPIRLQNNSSSVCGYYCISYVSNRLKGISPSKILKKLNYGDTKLNDCKVYTNISKKFRIKKKLSTKQTCCTFKVFKRKLKE